MLEKCTDIEIRRNDTSTFSEIRLINQMHNISRQDFRFTDLLFLIRAELKLQVFNREYLNSQLKQKIKSFSIIIFVDDFELYRNLYRSLMSVYVVSVKLLAIERQKSSNCYTITLDSHDCDFNDIMNCLCINLKNIDHDCVFEIREQKKII